MADTLNAERRNTLRSDVLDVVGVDRRGGKAFWRDDDTLIVSGCEQIGAKQLALLNTLHPQAHIVVCSNMCGVVGEGSGSGFVVLVTILPNTRLALSGAMVELVVVVSVYVASLALLVS